MISKYDQYDLLFLLRALRVEAHQMKANRPGYAKMLFEKLDRIQPQLEQ
jgi:hypothetical protein